ncbi:MAG: UDP-N-acetylmuramoyl-L-alanine--D-glutamate ligase [Gaiellaceae bacterium]
MRFSELDGAQVGVWGAGREIRSFATQLAQRLPSARLAIVASDDALDDRARAALKAPAAEFVSGSGVLPALAGCDVVVRSPGVSIYRAEMEELRRQARPVTTATALWLEERGPARVVGVTGTKGKSTTAAVIAHLAGAAGWSVSLAGNIGLPALDLLDVPDADVTVIELSSYQIADLAVGPETAVFTNLYHEHVDWHGSHEVYCTDKLRMLELPGVATAVVNARDPVLTDAADGNSRVLFYGVSSGWDASGDGVSRRGELVIPRSRLPLLGEHNALNVCAAAAALEVLGVDPVPRPDVLAGFRPLPHRLEQVAERDGVLWVDDSISTTPESTAAALESLGGRDVVLIGGGHDRGQDYAELGRTLSTRGAAVIGLPVTGARLVAAARAAGVAHARAVEAVDMEAAVATARDLARPGVAVLLSPGAPSYGVYRDFVARGQHFRRLIGA